MRTGQRRTRWFLLAAAAVLAAVAAMPAAAAASATSINWAGYIASGRKFRRVTATWVQPQARCFAGRAGYSAYWVGLGGASSSSRGLEQTGTEADCSPSGRSTYSAWFELLPAAARRLSLQVSPGDAITATVSVSGGTVRIRIANRTRRTVAARTVRTSSIDVSSADWIVEAPSNCDQSGCQLLPLANFGTVVFGGASATPLRGRAHAIAYRGWTATAITLQGSGQSRTSAAASVADAVPSALSRAGSAFSVSYRGRSASPAQPSAPLFRASH